VKFDASKKMKEEKEDHVKNEDDMRKDKTKLKEDYKNSEYANIGDIVETEA